MFSTPLPISPSPDEPTAESKRYPRRHGVGVTWVWQILYILYCLEVGVFLILLPWLSIWDSNYLIYRYPVMQPLVTNPYLKGAVLGLGIVNVLIGIQEIVQFRKRPKRLFP